MKFAYVLVNTTFGYPRIDSVQYGAGAKERAAKEAAERRMRMIRVLVKTALTLHPGAALPKRYCRTA